ncbi:MAG: hypothetical protein Q8N91_04420 [Candidatus Omnitrophota bacterium]|nr:hypothetical protein [Candidatus Omnitrophota bacterium]
MNDIKRISAVAIIINFIALFSSHAQPNIPRENIPKDASVEIRKEIEKLYSPDAIERAEAAIHLGWMGSKAAPAIPFLKAMLNDNAPIEWEYVDIPRSEIPLYKPFTPGEEAKSAVESMLKEIPGQDLGPSQTAGVAGD